jgi:hypothetical protein
MFKDDLVIIFCALFIFRFARSMSSITTDQSKLSWNSRTARVCGIKLRRLHWLLDRQTSRSSFRCRSWRATWWSNIPISMTISKHRRRHSSAHDVAHRSRQTQVSAATVGRTCSSAISAGEGSFFHVLFVKRLYKCTSLKNFTFILHSLCRLGKQKKHSEIDW